MANEAKEFKPYISADRVVPEFTVVSVILGIILAVVFGAANAYLGLRVGLTVSASIPAAVISMGVIRVILKRDSILENNLVQTIGSAGESVAAGAIFTLPALFLWAKEWGTNPPKLLDIFLIALVGGVLGILFMIPLRKALIVEEHGVLPYPEGTACAEVLLAGEEGGAKASSVFAGLGIAGAYKFITDGLGIFPSSVSYEFKGYKGAGVGIDILPALVGVGYICGPRISSYMFCGGVLSWLVLMPLISLFGGDAVVFPGEIPIGEMNASTIWDSYIRYIGAGAVATGGILSLIKSLPLIVKTFKQAMKSMSKKQESTVGNSLRTDQDIPFIFIIVGVVVIAFAIWLLPQFEINLLGAFIVVIFGFFFATVSSRLVGLIGSSNNPVSGMAIATLLIATLLLKATGASGQSGMINAISIGSIICIVAAIAGDTSQDLKTGYILGATPKRQQYGELIGVVSSAITIGFVLYLLSTSWGGYGSEQLPAPQATMMQMIVEGVMEANLPWTFIGAGAGLAIIMEILRIPVLPFAVGMYLPFSLNAGIMTGGLVRLFVDKKKNLSEKERKSITDRGILYTSGMIAGEGLVGIILAVLAAIPLSGNFENVGQLINLGRFLPYGTGVAQILGLVLFVLLVFSLLKVTIFNKKK